MTRIIATTPVVMARAAAPRSTSNRSVCGEFDFGYKETYQTKDQRLELEVGTESVRSFCEIIAFDIKKKVRMFKTATKDQYAKTQKKNNSTSFSFGKIENMLSVKKR